MMITMGEFIAMHKLEVDLKDSGATRLIAKKLRGAGYVRVKRRYKDAVQWVWMKQSEDRMHRLNARLEVIDIP